MGAVFLLAFLLPAANYQFHCLSLQLPTAAAACQSGCFYPSPPISAKQRKPALSGFSLEPLPFFTCVSPRAAKHMERNTFPPLVKTKNTTQSRYAQGHPIRLCPAAHLPVLAPPKRRPPHKLCTACRVRVGRSLTLRSPKKSIGPTRCCGFTSQSRFVPFGFASQNVSGTSLFFDPVSQDHRSPRGIPRGGNVLRFANK